MGGSMVYIYIRPIHSPLVNSKPLVSDVVPRSKIGNPLPTRPRACRAPFRLDDSCLPCRSGGDPVGRGRRGGVAAISRAYDRSRLAGLRHQRAASTSESPTSLTQDATSRPPHYPASHPHPSQPDLENGAISTTLSPTLRQHLRKPFSPKPYHGTHLSQTTSPTFCSQSTTTASANNPPPPPPPLSHSP